MQDREKNIGGRTRSNTIDPYVVVHGFEISVGEQEVVAMDPHIVVHGLEFETNKIKHTKPSCHSRTCNKQNQTHTTILFFMDLNFKLKQTKSNKQNKHRSFACSCCNIRASYSTSQNLSAEKKVNATGGPDRHIYQDTAQTDQNLHIFKAF